MSKEKPNQNKKSQKTLKRWTALSGIGIQMGATIYICAWGGKKLDEHFQVTKKWFTIGFVLFGVIASLFLLLQELKYLNRDKDK